MIRRALVFCLLAALTGCKPNEVSKTKAIIGAVLIDGNGGPPITDSVVVVSGSRIRSAGLRANVPIPADSDKINGSGKFLIPGLIDAYCVDDRNGTGSAVTAVRLVSGNRAQFIRADSNATANDVILEEARKSNVPVTAAVTTLAQAEQLVKSGVAGFAGMIADTGDVDQAFLAKLRALNIVFTPALTSIRDGRAFALRNTKRMAAAGVPIAVGSGASCKAIQRELELLVEAGLSPLEVTTAATRNGALAVGRLAELGTIEAGKRADLVLLNANPLEDVRNFGKIDRVMLEGEWTAPASR